MPKKRSYLGILSFVLIAFSALFIFRPLIGILLAMAAILIQVFRGVFHSKKAIAAGIVLVFIHSALIVLPSTGLFTFNNDKSAQAPALVSGIQNGDLPSGVDFENSNLTGIKEGSIDADPVAPPENIPKSSFEFDWEMIAVFMGILTSVTGWYVSKKHRKETLLLINEIDGAYDGSKLNPKESLDKLTQIKERLKKEFDTDKLDEATFQLLYKMVERDISEVSASMQESPKP